MSERTVPVYILSGFLGSGKTTLLSQALRQQQEQGRKAAVVMNELGEVNLDGVAVGMEVPMAELLDGCICCTVRGDLGLSLQQLLDAENPDVLFIEATGVAHPMEILEGVTDASLYRQVEVRAVITVVDAGQLKEQRAKGTGKTYRLLKEQVRTADILLLNKIDLLPDPQDQQALEAALREWNPHARLIPTVLAQVEPSLFNEPAGTARALQALQPAAHTHASQTHDSEHASHGDAAPGHHHSHNHVMVVTRYLKGPVDSRAFEALASSLPDSVYRAKGILTFRDTRSRYLFQYAYRQPDFMRIEPQAAVPDVVVFIGENLHRQELEAALDRLELASAEDME